MLTIKDVYDIAIAHMDELDHNGDTVNGNTKDYEHRTPALVTALWPECFLRDSHYQAVMDEQNRGRPPMPPGHRPPPPGRPHTEYRTRPGAQVFTAMTDEVPLDDELALTVLPYGLAAGLLADENPPLAQFFQQRYEELLATFEVIGPRVRQPTDWEPIEDVYGWGSGPRQGRW